MNEPQRDNNGILSRNDDKQKPDANPNWPDYKGIITLDGKSYWLAGWVKAGRNGKFLSLAVKPKHDAPTAPTPADEATPASKDTDDNLPF